MAIVIKEIHVQAVIEKKVVQLTDISVRMLDKIKKDVLLELQERRADPGRKRNER